LKAVLFDLGGTLIKTTPVPEILKRILERYGIKRSSEEIASAQCEVEEQLSLEDYALPASEFWFLWNMKILKKLNVHENIKALAEGIAKRWWSNACVELYPNVKETLKKLKEEGLKIGVVTNGFQSDIDEILARTCLSNFFDVTVGVDAVGKPKPSEEIFLYALKKLRFSAKETLFVGDNPETDYVGAEKAGLKALLIDRDNKMCRRIRKIQDLSEIMKYL